MTPVHRHAPGHHAPELRAAALRLGRRRFLTGTAAAATLAFSVGLPAAGVAGAAELDARQITDNPFTLGVASGDPRPDSILIWTRLAPDPYETDSGLPQSRIDVDWELAHDALFSRIAKSGTTPAHPEYNHSARVDVSGLESDRVYYYRFRAGTWISPTGRTRTAPARDAELSQLRFAAVSCQAYHDGYFTAYKHLAAEDLDVVFHLGDYLYEYAVTAVGGVRNYTDRRLPAHFNRETVTLEDYRLRYGLYKSDPDLQAAHAAHPFVVTWDDHETENNYADSIPENDVPPAEFLLRRAAAYRAYWENLPLRAQQQPAESDAQLYRRLHFGRLAQFDVLDTRQYRSDQVYGDGWQVPGPDMDDPSRTLTGATQERWLLDGWTNSEATWNVLSQQLTFSQRRSLPTPGFKLSMDSWDGYPVARQRIVNGVEAAGLKNFMVLTGDVHTAYAYDLKTDWNEPESRTYGTEIVATSISSGRDGTDKPADWDAFTRANPHMKLYNGRRGYVTVALGTQQARADFRTVSAISTPGAPVETVASFVTEIGDQGLNLL